MLDRAAQGATRAFDRNAVVGAARRAGVPVEENPADQAARTLLHELAAGRPPGPGLRRLLADALPTGAPPASSGAGDIALWAGASATERGQALRDLLGLADQLPVPTRRRLRFPGLRADARG